MGWPASGEMDKKGRSLGSRLGAGPVSDHSAPGTGGGQDAAQGGDARRDVVLSPVSTAQGQQTEAGPS